MYVCYLVLLVEEVGCVDVGVCFVFIVRYFDVVLYVVVYYFVLVV